MSYAFTFHVVTTGRLPLSASSSLMTTLYFTRYIIYWTLYWRKITWFSSRVRFLRFPRCRHAAISVIFPAATRLASRIFRDILHTLTHGRVGWDIHSCIITFPSSRHRGGARHSLRYKRAAFSSIFSRSIAEMPGPQPCPIGIIRYIADSYSLPRVSRRPFTWSPLTSLWYIAVAFENKNASPASSLPGPLIVIDAYLLRPRARKKFIISRRLLLLI